MFRFSIRDLFWLTLVAALLTVGFLDRNRLETRIEGVESELAPLVEKERKSQAWSDYHKQRMSEFSESLRKQELGLLPSAQEEKMWPGVELPPDSLPTQASDPSLGENNGSTFRGSPP